MKQETKNDCVIVGGVLGGLIRLLAVIILCTIVGWVLSWLCKHYGNVTGKKCRERMNLKVRFILFLV